MQYSDAISNKSESGSDDVFDIKRIDIDGRYLKRKRTTFDIIEKLSSVEIIHLRKI